MEKCLFCANKIDPFSVDPEHIIPSFIHGSLVTYQVCRSCNGYFGSKVDSGLQRHRHIWDAYKKVDFREKPKTPFSYLRSWVEDDKGNEIEVHKRSNVQEVLTYKTEDKGIRFDFATKRKKDPVINTIYRKAKKYGIKKDKITRDCINPYLKWVEGKNRGTSDENDFYFRNKFFEIRVQSKEKTGTRQSLMNADVPKRFVAKVCVEMANLVGLEKKLENLNKISSFARNGETEEINLGFNFDLGEGLDPKPFHSLYFLDDLFVVSFFGKYFAGIQIRWKESPKDLFFINDLIQKRLYKGKSNSANRKEFIGEEFEIEAHVRLGRKSHV